MSKVKSRPQAALIVMSLPEGYGFGGVPAGRAGVVCVGGLAVTPPGVVGRGATGRVLGAVASGRVLGTGAAAVVGAAASYALTIASVMSVDCSAQKTGGSCRLMSRIMP